MTERDAFEAQLHTEGDRALEVLRVGGGVGLEERPQQVEEDGGIDTGRERDEQMRRRPRGRVADERS